jgi:hypothetical protein
LGHRAAGWFGRAVVVAPANSVSTGRGKLGCGGPSFILFKVVALS